MSAMPDALIATSECRCLDGSCNNISLWTWVCIPGRPSPLFEKRRVAEHLRAATEPQARHHVGGDMTSANRRLNVAEVIA